MPSRPEATPTMSTDPNPATEPAAIAESSGEQNTSSSTEAIASSTEVIPTSTSPAPARWITFQSYILIASAIGSLVIIGWSVLSAVPALRSPGKSTEMSQTHQPESLLKPNRETRLGDDEYLEMAIALDEELMKSRVRRHRPARRLPGAEQARQRWQRQVDQLRLQLNAASPPKPGTLHWHQLQLLRMLYEDAPALSR